MSDHFVGKLELVKRVVAGHFCIQPALLDSPRRARALARPRQLAMAIARELVPGQSLPQIGASFGGRDHTTVMHAVDKVAELREEDPSFDDVYERLRSECVSALAVHDVGEDTKAKAMAVRLVERIGRQMTAGLMSVALERPDEFVACVMRNEPMPRHSKPGEPATPARDVAVGTLWAFREHATAGGTSIAPKPPKTMEQIITGLRGRAKAKREGKWPLTPNFKTGAVSPQKAVSR